jgi:hypothetical protein
MVEPLVPEHLAPTVKMLRAAFPDGLAREDALYHPLITVLYRSDGGLSFRNLADTLTIAFGIDRGIALNDAYGVAADLDAAGCRDLVARLQLHGYDEWNVDLDRAPEP